MKFIYFITKIIYYKFNEGTNFHSDYWSSNQEINVFKNLKYKNDNQC